jgi:PleD family two-component response regulator
MTNSITILIVDDDPEIRFASTRILKNSGFNVIEESSGNGCLDAVRKKTPSLVLLDVVLPDISGIEVCRCIKSDPALKQTFVVLLSGVKTGSDSQAEGLEMGADGYIVRPVSNREFLARVQAYFRIIIAERERDRTIQKLQEALSTIKTLSGLLPICANCKKVRDDKGYWKQIEAYVQEHSEAEFSHGICPDCAKKLYPEFDLYPPKLSVPEKGSA